MGRVFAVLGVVGVCVFVRVGVSQTMPATGAATGAGATTEPAKIKITIGRDTTYLLDPPLRADGTVDYVRAYDEEQSKGVTGENNAYLSLLKLFGPGTLSSKTRDKVLARLGIEHLPAEGDYFQTFVDFSKAEGMDKEEEQTIEEEMDEAMRRAWKEDDHPEIAAWLKRNEKALDGVVAASGRERYYAPAVGESMISVLLPALGRCREAANSLAMRAMLRAGEGKVDEACKDALAVHRLGRLISQGGTLIEKLVGYAMDGMGVRADEGIISTNQLTQAQAKGCLRDLRGLAPVGSFADGVGRGERFMTLDAVMMIARGKGRELHVLAGGEVPPADWMLQLTPEQSRGVNWDGILRGCNGYYDSLVAAAGKGTFAERQAAFKEAESDAEKRRKQNSAVMAVLDVGSRVRMFVMGTLGAFGRADVLYERTLMHEQLDEIGFALAAERGRVGRYPETLAGLEGGEGRAGYFKSLPVDRFTGGALHYSTTPEGGFLVYSVNDDGEDDGGIDKPVKGKKWTHGDLVFRVGD